ncbi:ATPase invovled in DNA repair [Halorubrum distributum JCM 9100]|uniref:ATPase invovled in DNA repair n=1 Tax=Halorubrum distributum JCM 9100 TaxID=1227467 RepID=M0EPH8_9EURY|nr:AAA family ATPase [Halorubrum distributum]ELZ48319.1 ATPase invovled in DNA repair [Halorubrum distributum JCM 9100]
MQLHRLHLTNFRQFRSETVEFALGDDQNVTVVHGQNGSGKTTLKNAFLWVLYDESNFNLRPDKLASQGALAEVDPGETVSVEVALEFEHEDVDYEVTRSYEYQRQATDDYLGEIVDEDLSLSYETADGKRGTRQNPQRSIEQILPDRLSDLFFFDGEYITQLSEGHSQDEVKQAIQNIMGLTIIERSIRHLGEVEGRFESEVQEHGNSELSDLIDTRSELRDEVEDLTGSIDTKKQSRQRLREEISEIERKLEGIEEAAELQEERNRLESRQDALQAEIAEINESIDAEISKKGHLPFVMPAIEATAQDLDDLRERGEIPSEVSNQFVDKLLAQGECICGRPLEEGTHPYDSVEAYRSDAAENGVDQAAIRIISHLTSIQDEQAEYLDTVDELLEERSELRDQLTSVDEQLDEIQGELEEMNITDPETGETPSELESARNRKKSEREELKREIWDLERDIETREERLEEIGEEIDEARQEESQAELARRRMQATSKVQQQLEASFEQLQNQVREYSNDLVSKTFDEIATKGYEAEITDEFELRIRDQLQGEYLEVDKSRGERQIASLTFIGSLVQIARERYESDTDAEYFSGGIYPIVMDSPFGALDDDHRRTVSRVIPRMAEQVVVLVTDSQWRGPVANEMNEIASRQYRLDFDDGDGDTSYPRTRIVEEEISQKVNQ